MKVDQHISELLYDHDCVIVPSFGGFLATYRNAVIHPTQHSFSPPSKKIAFNIFLKQNDGLLANHISNLEKLSYTDALVQVEQHVNRWKNELEEGRKLILERIGTFYFDAEKNLQFEPEKNVNYLRDAFGLDMIQFLPVKRENEEQKLEKQLKQMTIRPSSRQERRPMKLSNKMKKKIVGSLILSGALFWLSLHFFLISPYQLDFSSLNPFSSNEKMSVAPAEKKQAVQQPVVVAPAITETVYVANTTPAEPELTASVGEKSPEKVPVETVSTPVENQNYFVIGGAFEVIGNAEAFVRTLQSEGFTQARILDTAQHLKKVCFSGFSTRAEAFREASRLNALGKSSWVYNR